MRGDALAQRVRPAELLKSGRDLGIVQTGIVAAVATMNRNELHPCQLRHSPQNRFYVRQIRVHRTRRLFQLILRGNVARYGHTTVTVTRTIAVDVVRIRAAHLNSPVSGSDHCRGLEQRVPQIPVTISPRFLLDNFDHLRRRAFI